MRKMLVLLLIVGFLVLGAIDAVEDFYQEYSFDQIVFSGDYELQDFLGDPAPCGGGGGGGGGGQPG